MKKLILTLVAANICSASFAYQATPGVKVSEPRIVNNGFKEFNVESKSQANGFLSPKFVSAMAMTSDVTARPGENARIKSWHNISISNYDNQTHRYTYIYRLVCENLNASYSRDVDIPPHGNFSDSSESFGTVQKDYEGAYGINAATQINGPESIFHDSGAVLRIRK